MATRSFIAKENPDGTYTAIYCHWDGYPSHNGIILRQHYKLKKLEKLLALGDISALRKNVDPNPSKAHDYRNDQKDVVVAYHRDRGDMYRPATTYSDTAELLAAANEMGAEYVYILSSKTGKWNCLTETGTPVSF